MNLLFSQDLVKPDLCFKYTKFIQDGNVPIIIDNGSYKCRAGWASTEDPLLVFRNLGIKQKNKKTLENEILVGNDISNLDQIQNQCRSPFEKNIVTQFDVQEQIFDHIFHHLQINSLDSDVPHPLVVTEPLSNPSYSREKMSELLFECYNVPSVQYGIDALFGLHYNNHIQQSQVFDSFNNNINNNNGFMDHLIISCGYNAFHIIPVLDGKLMKCRRFNYGGNSVDAFMMKSLHLKYPGHMTNITQGRAEYIVQKNCRLAVDFNKELMNWPNDSYYEDHVIKFQLPFNQAAAQKISTEHQKQKQEEQIKRLKEMNLKRRQEKLMLEQEKLSHYMSLMELIHEEIEENGDDDNDVVNNILLNNNLSNIHDLQMIINNLNNSIELMQDKIMTCIEQNLESGKSKAKKAKFDKNKFVDISSMPSVSDVEGRRKWMDQLKEQRQQMIDKMNERKNRRNEMMRRRTIASHHRISIISELAQGNKKLDDEFGMNDDDWNVYKEINRDSRNSDSEKDLDQLEEMETCLQEYDPQFRKIDVDESLDLREYYQIHVALEQIRVPELLYQPSMMGFEQAGLCEGLGHVLQQFQPQQQLRLVNDIFVIGGCACFPNFGDRLKKELNEIRPFETKFNIRIANNPVLDAWKGARLWSLDSSVLQKYSTSRSEYYEFGGDYIKDCCISNKKLTIHLSDDL